jgi:DNA-binding response OmpR family regulator
MKRILIIEDDPAILKGLEVSLKEEHYEVLTAADGEKGYQTGKRANVDLIILDIMLPNKNGQEICRDLRKDGVNTPILMLTSKKGETDKVLGLELGADDYVTKPFSVRELHARIKALLRRKVEIKKDIDDFAFGNVQLDFKKQEASKNKKHLELSSREFNILKHLIQHEGEVVTRDMLLDDVWGYEVFPTTRTVDNYMLSIRKKIEENPAKPKHLITVHTTGYKFVK